MSDVVPAGTGDSTDFVAVGRIGPARGVGGDVFVEPWTDAPEQRFAPGAVLRTRNGTMTVLAAANVNGRQVVRFDGVADRSGAERLRGTELFVAAAERPALDDPDEYYDSDLVGLAVVDRSGATLGTVQAVSHAGPADYLVVDVSGRECLVPFVAAIVPEVDLSAGQVVVEPPEGLFDL